MARIMKFAPLSDELLIMSLIYLDRFMERNTDTLLSRLNIHRLMLTSVVLSAKFNSDFFYTNSYYAHVGGVTCLEMNALERTFLTKLNYHLTVQKEEFTVYHNEMLKHAAKAQGNYCVTVIRVDFVNAHNFGSIRTKFVNSIYPCFPSLPKYEIQTLLKYAA
jgi:hypothetical protein